MQPAKATVISLGRPLLGAGPRRLAMSARTGGLSHPRPMPLRVIPRLPLELPQKGKRCYSAPASRDFSSTCIELYMRQQYDRSIAIEAAMHWRNGP